MRLRLALVLLAVLLLAALVASPWAAARRLFAAVERGDARAIARLVDFAALRQPLAGRVAEGAPAAQRGEILDRMLTPEGFVRMAQNAPDADAERPAAEPGPDRSAPARTLG